MYGNPAYDTIRLDLGARMEAHMVRLRDLLLGRFRTIWNVY